ncbi:hypothetical protein P9112_011020 [Eukaryota sp. TZLM1-RC]
MNFYRLTLWSILVTYIYMVIFGIYLNSVNSKWSPPEMSFSIGTCYHQNLMRSSSPIARSIGYWRKFELTLFRRYDDQHEFDIQLSLRADGVKISYNGISMVIGWEHTVAVSTIRPSLNIYRNECSIHNHHTFVPLVTVCRPLFGTENISCHFFKTKHLPSAVFVLDKFFSWTYEDPEEANHFPYVHAIISASLFLIATFIVTDFDDWKLDKDDLTFTMVLVIVVASGFYLFCLFRLYQMLSVLLHFYSKYMHLTYFYVYSSINFTICFV